MGSAGWLLVGGAVLVEHIPTWLEPAPSTAPLLILASSQLLLSPEIHPALQKGATGHLQKALVLVCPQLCRSGSPWCCSLCLCRAESSQGTAFHSSSTTPWHILLCSALQTIHLSPRLTQGAGMLQVIGDCRGHSHCTRRYDKSQDNPTL